MLYLTVYVDKFGKYFSNKNINEQTECLIQKLQKLCDQPDYQTIII